MDGFLKQAMKFGQEQLSGDQNQNQNQGQGGYGGQQQQHHNQQQQQYPSGNDDNYGQQGGADYSQSNQGNYGGYNSRSTEGGNYGGQNNYGNNQSGGDFGVTGGAQFNRPHGQGGAGGAPGGFGLDPSAALDAAGANGKHQADSSLFSSALGMLQGMGNNPSAAQVDDLDEDDVQRKHEQAYGQGNAGGMSANAMGAAAALQAMKKFTSGSGGQQAQFGGGNMQSSLIGMAMKEAAKLFDQSGGAASGTKQDAVSGAGATIMKLLLKQQMGGMMGGGNSGGLSQLMGMASKFM